MKRASEVKNVLIEGNTLRGPWVVTTVYVIDDAVTNGGETYVCILGHTAAAGDEPGVGGSWTTYWVLVDFVASGIFEFYPNFVGILHMPAAWTAADIGFLASAIVDGTFQPLYDKAGNLVVISGPLADRAYNLPDELAGSLFVKLWSNTAGANEAQGGDRQFALDLKA